MPKPGPRRSAPHTVRHLPMKWIHRAEGADDMVLLTATSSLLSNLPTLLPR